MPKKLNFLGGQQNYNPNTGEYEPSLQGPNGESPSSFKKFKKGDEEKNSFNEYNDKRLGKTKEETTSFKLDKNKYPDVEETPYGFIYNVNGQSITDLKEQGKKLGEQIDENKQYGFSLTKGGDEVFYETFEDAYNAAKSGHTNKDLKMAKKIDEEMKPVFEDAKKKDAEIDNRLDKFAEKFGIEFKDIRDEFVKRYQRAIKEQGFGGKDAIDAAMDTLEDDLVMGWKPEKQENSFKEYNGKRTGKKKLNSEQPKLTESQHNKKIATETAAGKMIKYHPLMRDVENKTYNFGEQQRAKMLNNGLAMETKKRSGLGYIKDQNGRYIPQQYYVLIDVETGLTCGRVTDYENGLEKTNDAEFIEIVNRARDAFKQKNAQLFNGE